MGIKVCIVYIIFFAPLANASEEGSKPQQLEPANVYKAFLLGPIKTRYERVRHIRDEIDQYRKVKELAGRLRITVLAVEKLQKIVREEDDMAKKQKGNLGAALDTLAKVTARAQEQVRSKDEKSNDLITAEQMIELHAWSDKFLSSKLNNISLSDRAKITTGMTYSSARTGGRFPYLFTFTRPECNESEMQKAYESIIKSNEDDFLANWNDKYAAIYTEQLEKENYPKYRTQLTQYFEQIKDPDAPAINVLLGHHFSEEKSSSSTQNRTQLIEIKNKYAKKNDSPNFANTERLAREIGMAAPNCLGFGLSIYGTKKMLVLKEKLKHLRLLKYVRELNLGAKEFVTSLDWPANAPVKTLNMGSRFAQLKNGKYFTYHQTEDYKIFSVVSEGDHVFPLVKATITEQDYKVLEDQSYKSN